MRITVDLSPAVHHHAGLGRYAQELTTALTALDDGDQYTAFYYSPDGAEKPDAPLDRLPARTLHLGAKPWRMSVLLAYMAGGSLDSWLPSSDLFHATDHLLPPLQHSRTVFTIHDLIFRFHPEYHLPLNRWYLTLMLPRFMQRANAIIAVSENTRRDAANLMGIPVEKMTVVYEGVNPAFRPIQDSIELARVRARYALPPRFILLFGTIEPRKNVLTLLDSYLGLLNECVNAPSLVLAGRKGWLYQPVFDRVRALGLESHVRFADWIEEADLPALFNLAKLFAYPSLYEGFGLPPLEAMACGTPVLCSNAASLPEVVGDGGWLIDPRDPSAWTQALIRTLSDDSLQDDLRARGLAQARKFTWERAARETREVYRRVGL